MKLVTVPLHFFHILLLSLLVTLSPAALTAADNPLAQNTVQFQVDINTADAMTLAEVMDGVGMIKAQAIVDYREQIGRFQSVEQLLEVSGIGLATLERNRHRLTVSPQ